MAKSSMIVNTTRNTVIASQAITADTIPTRMKGLLGKDNLSPGEALIITHCQSIHMFFMNFPIDVIFCDQEHRVVGLCEDIQPFCLSPIFFKASYAIELTSGSIALSKTQMGDELSINK